MKIGQKIQLISIIILWICIGINSSYIYFNNQESINNFIWKGSEVESNELKIIYDDLSEEDIIAVNSMFADLNNKYLNETKQITFMGNQTKLANTCGNPKETFDNNSSLVSLGCESGGNIYVYVSKYNDFNGGTYYFYELTRTNLCHELVHTIINVGDREFFADEFENYCYDSFSLERNEIDSPWGNFSFEINISTVFFNLSSQSREGAKE